MSKTSYFSGQNVAILIVIALIIAGSIYPMDRKSICITYEVKNDVNGLTVALDVYHSDYGKFPTGDSLNVIKTLCGDNPKQRVYFEFSHRRLSPDGHFLDPWGTPYRIDTSNTSKPRVWSAGKNKIDEPETIDSDDVCNWR